MQGLLILITYKTIFMSDDKNKRNDRPEAYPRPTETDQQLQNQPEFIDQQPNEFDDKTVSDVSERTERTEEQGTRKEE